MSLWREILPTFGWLRAMSKYTWHARIIVEVLFPPWRFLLLDALQLKFSADAA
jgi:hypothetical protein